MIRVLVMICLLAFAGCAAFEESPAPQGAAAPDGMLRPQPRPEALDTNAAPAPPPDARTAEDFDTTDEAARAAAVVGAPEAGARRLGTTIGALGSAAEPGIWIKTPLVTEVTQGRADYPAAGTSIAVELRPSGGVPGAGSQVSLAAMRLLQAPLTGLPELVLFAQ